MSITENNKVNEYINIKNQNSVSVLVNTSTGEGFKIYNNLTKKTNLQFHDEVCF